MEHGAFYWKLENHVLWAWSEMVGSTCMIFVPKSRLFATNT